MFSCLLCCIVNIICYKVTIEQYTFAKKEINDSGNDRVMLPEGKRTKQFCATGPIFYIIGVLDTFLKSSNGPFQILYLTNSPCKNKLIASQISLTVYSVEVLSILSNK
jgi:hypothetical protein